MAGRGAGDTAHFPGLAGNWSMARALVRGDLQALRLAPRMLRKRARDRPHPQALARAKCGG